MLAASGVGDVGAGASGAPSRVRVPDLVGLSRVQVYRVMRADRLYFVTRGPGAATSSWRSVESQSPRPGTVVARDSQVEVRVWMVPARGPRRVPDLVGRSRAQVFFLMREYQLYFTVRGAVGTRWAVATAQSPRPGTLVPWHAQVTVDVALRRATRPRPSASATATASVAHPVSVTPTATHAQDGIATWYNYIPGQCASPYLAKGTTITVIDLATRKSVTCVVTDREQAGDDHVIDLNQTQFAELAPLGQGVIRVRVLW
ncbi:MAG: PASTA domain-containing protein [Acidimicrobiales bacterium]